MGKVDKGITEDSSFLTFNDGTVLDVEGLLKHQAKLAKLITYMKGNDKFKKYLSEIRFGVYGPTLTTIDKVLDAVEAS